MSRAMGLEDTELFRVVERYPQVRDGEPTGKAGDFVSGPYRTLGSARAARSREQRRPMSDKSTFTIERAPVVWEVVE